MNLVYLLETNQNEVLLTNVSQSQRNEIESRNFFYNPGLKEGKFSLPSGWLYLRIDNKNVTKKIYSYYKDCLATVLETIIESYREIHDDYDDRVKRLKHNIEGYNAKIQDQLENILPSSGFGCVKNWKDILKSISSEIKRDPDFVAESLLHIMKNVKLSNAELEVYNVINSGHYAQNIVEHPIRKVIDLSIQSFFLDLLKKHVRIEVDDTDEKVLADFPSLSVVLGHILDNAVKYIACGSSLNVNFSNEGEMLVVSFNMTSVFVEQTELSYIFKENYSGVWATSLGENGYGIGMYYAKRLMEFNRGSIDFIRGPEKYRFNNIPYADNVIQMRLERYLD